jgi:hypothetical protein
LSSGRTSLPQAGIVERKHWGAVTVKHLLVISAFVSFAFSGANAVVSAGYAQSPANVSARDQIEAIAAGSKCAAYLWKNRGLAPPAYIKGVALVFAKSVCQAGRQDTEVVSTAEGAPGSPTGETDALTWYDSIFRNLGMPNDKDDTDTLRHAYSLLIGLGMRESSGKYCAGRDSSEDFTSADSAEAGVFQTSWGASRTNPSLPAMFRHYSADQSGCMLDVFRKGVTCGPLDQKNWGVETEAGFAWQKLTKACPAFSTEYAAVVVRKSGGRKGEFGPLRNRAAEVRPECDSMLLDVQKLVQANPGTCSSL